MLSGHQQWSVQEQQKEGGGEEVEEEDEEQEQEEEVEQDTKLPKASALLFRLQATQGPALASFNLCVITFSHLLMSRHRPGGRELLYPTSLLGLFGKTTFEQFFCIIYNNFVVARQLLNSFFCII